MTFQSTNAAFLAAQDAMRIDDLNTALLFLDQARNEANTQRDAPGELAAILLQAKIHHRREDLSTARLYTEEAAQLLADSSGLDPKDRANAYLGLARLSPDTGQLALGFEYAQQALRLYQKIGDRRGQYDAHIVRKLIAQQRGHHQIAVTHLQEATQLARTLRLGPEEETFLLNTRGHTLWYRGQLPGALQAARDGIALADSAGPLKFRVYNRLLCANILRARQEYAAAEAMYAETEQIIEETGFALFRVWVEANRAWLDALQTHYEQVRRRLFFAFESADRGQIMSLNVFLAGVFSLTGRLREAEDLLIDSLHFYLTSGDDLSVYAIRIYLAYINLKMNRIPMAEENLALALAWASQWNVEYFPHWWYPLVVAEVCVHALVTEIHPAMAERILVKRVGEQAVPFLRDLLAHATLQVRQRAADALSLLDRAPLDLITRTKDERVRQVLNDLFRNGVLREAQLGSLAQRLQVARSQPRINPVLLATFGLYVQGMNRQEIAQCLNRQEKTIRNCITLIYDCFGLEDDGSRSERRQQLVDLAQSEGLIGR